MTLLLTQNHYNEAKKKGWIKKGWDFAEKNNQYKKLKKFSDMGFVNNDIESMNAEYWMVGSIAPAKIEVIK